MKVEAMREAIYRKSDEAREHEPVPGDFLIKKTGMDIISKFVSMDECREGLEIGCGSGYNAALLSATAGNLIATDLPDYDARSHCLGISVAKGLLAKLGVKNVEIVSCSGENLPFKDNQFDFVFSSSVLEHIKDKEAALREMMRVVKSGGVVIFAVPTYVQSICAFAHLYLYIAIRVLEVAAVKMFGRGAGAKKVLLPKADDLSRPAFKITRSFRESHPSFPLPEPHGTYKNVFQEFNQQLPWKWTALTKKCGARGIESFAFLFIPFNIMEVFSTRIVALLYSNTKSLHCLIAKSWLKYFSYSYCVVAKK